MKLLLLDIETAPHRVYAWGLYDQDIAISQIVEPGYTLCYAAKWIGEKKMMFDSVQKSSALQMVKGIHALLSEADAVIHFNGEKFDIPTLNKEFITHGLTPPRPYKQIDLIRTCRKRFRFASNKLDYVAQALGEGAKVQHKGMELWRACMEPKHADYKSAWRTMEAYNRGDVLLTERLYLRLLPWIEHHPNHALYNNRAGVRCPSCDSANLQMRGFRRTKTARYRQFSCNDCGSWSRDKSMDKETDTEGNPIRPRPDLTT